MWPSEFSVLAIKRYNQKQPRRERAYFCLEATLHHWGKPGPELNQDLKQRSWKTAASWLVLCLLLKFCPQWTGPSSHQSLIKMISTDMITDQSAGGTLSWGSLLPGHTRRCQVDNESWCPMSSIWIFSSASSDSVHGDETMLGLRGKLRGSALPCASVVSLVDPEISNIFKFEVINASHLSVTLTLQLISFRNEDWLPPPNVNIKDIFFQLVKSGLEMETVTFPFIRNQHDVTESCFRFIDSRWLIPAGESARSLK